MRILTITLLLSASLLCHGQRTDASPAVQDISPTRLDTLMRQAQVSIIDVNEAENYAAAHVPGAKRMDYDAINAEALPPQKDSALVFYCWSAECPAAGMAAEAAVRLGFTDVFCMRTGITGWQDAGLPTEP